MKSGKRDGWYVRKSFPHLDSPIGFRRADSLVRDTDRVSKHAFLPFLSFIDKKRRFKPNNPKSPKNYDVKERPIRYCSHVDGCIHSFYALSLSNKYEEFVRNQPFNKSVIGYRSHIGTNVHMAKNAFDEIKKRNTSRAIAIDISDFFGSIDHAILKHKICRVLGTKKLREDWFNVFKSMTRYSWIDRGTFINSIGGNPKAPNFPICTPQEFRNARKSDPTLIKRNNFSYGIPQGSPLSAVLSNVYMIDFDKEVYEYVKNLSGYYRRYSDDILVVCDPKHQASVINKLESEIKNLSGKMSINHEKVDISDFFRDATGNLSCDHPITYLGFTFDGQRTLLRARTLSRYYRRVTYAARGVTRAARNAKSRKVFKRKLLRELSHLGRQNFYSYAKSAAEILDDPTPKRQLRRHMSIIKRKINNRGR